MNMKRQQTKAYVWDAAKAVLRGKFVVIMPTLRKNKDLK